jgi:hypothetical protein
MLRSDVDGPYAAILGPAALLVVANDVIRRIRVGTM